MENRNIEWTREIGERDKLNLINALKSANAAVEDIEWISDQLDKLIDAKEKSITDNL